MRHFAPDQQCRSWLVCARARARVCHVSASLWRGARAVNGTKRFVCAHFCCGCEMLRVVDVDVVAAVDAFSKLDCSIDMPYILGVGCTWIRNGARVCVCVPADCSPARRHNLMMLALKTRGDHLCKRFAVLTSKCLCALASRLSLCNSKLHNDNDMMLCRRCRRSVVFAVAAAGAAVDVDGGIEIDTMLIPTIRMHSTSSCVFVWGYGQFGVCA